MGKIKPGVPTGNLVLLTQPDSRGECTVYLRHFFGKYVKRSTGIHVSMKDWDACRECLKTSAPDAARINATLIGIKSELDNRLLSYGKVITLDVLSHILNGGDPAIIAKYIDNQYRSTSSTKRSIDSLHLGQITKYQRDKQ